MLFLNLIFADVNILNKANELYKNSRFEEALNEYLKIENKNPFLYYNIGNTYYRIGKKGYALLYYKRAYYLLPRDTEIRNNIEIIEGKRRFENPIIGFFYRFVNSFSFNESFLIFLIFYGTGTIILTIFFIKRNLKMLIFSIVLIFISLIFSLPSVYWLVRINSKECVIVEDTIGRSGPGDNFQEIIEFKEGISGKVLKRDNEWFLFTNGKEIGWVKGSLKFVIEK